MSEPPSGQTSGRSRRVAWLGMLVMVLASLGLLIPLLIQWWSAHRHSTGSSGPGAEGQANAFRISLQSCEELYEPRPGKIDCQLSPGSRFTWVLEQNDAKSLPALVPASAPASASASASTPAPEQTHNADGTPFFVTVAARCVAMASPQGSTGNADEPGVSIQETFTLVMEPVSVVLPYARSEAMSWPEALPGSACQWLALVSSTAPTPPPRDAEQQKGWWQEWSRHPGFVQVKTRFVWQEALAKRLIPGSTSAHCFESNQARRHDAEAIALCKSAWESPPTSPDPSEHVRMGNLYALALRLEGQYAEAADVMLEVAKVAGQTGVVRRQRIALHNRADILSRMPDGMLDALRTLQEAATLARRIDDRFGLADALRKEGQLLMQLGRYGEARQKFFDALALAHPLHAEELEARTNVYLGRVEAQLGNLNSAQHHLDLALPFYERKDQEAKQGDRSLWEDLGYFFGNAGIVRSLNLWQQQRLDHADAIEQSCFERAIAYFEQLGRPEQVLEFTLWIADLRIRQQDLAGAQSALTRAQEKAGQALTLSSADFVRLQGEVALAQSQWADALAYFQRLQALAPSDAAENGSDATGNSAPTLTPSNARAELSWLAAFGQARALGGKGEMAACAAKLQEAISGLERTAHRVDPGVDRSLFIGEREAVFRYAEQVRLSIGDVAGALNMAERSRVLSALASRLQARARYLEANEAGTLRQYTETLDELSRTARPDPRDQLLGAEARQAREAQRAAAEKSLQASRLALTRFLEGDDGRQDGNAPLPPLELAQVQSSLTEDEGLVVYSAETRAMTAYFIRPHSVESRRLPFDEQRLLEQVTQARAQLLAGAQGIDDPALTETLLGPMRSKLPTRLVIVPYGALYQLPFHALLVNEKRLLDQTEVRYLPSLSQWLSPQQSSPPGPEQALVIGNATRDLQSTDLEATRVASLFQNATLLLQAQATREALLRLLPSLDVLHFAGHGVQAPENSPEGGAGILLAQRAPLTAFDLLPRPLRAHLVVLSACDTSGGLLTTGGDLHGLATAFLGAGAHEVLATQWDLQQGDALPMLERFYQHRQKESLPVGEAWRRAAMAAASGELGAASQHPRVWAGFVLWGRR